jgi:hypothetical protein
LRTGKTGTTETSRRTYRVVERSACRDMADRYSSNFTVSRPKIADWGESLYGPAARPPCANAIPLRPRSGLNSAATSRSELGGGHNHLCAARNAIPSKVALWADFGCACKATVDVDNACGPLRSGNPGTQSIRLWVCFSLTWPCWHHSFLPLTTSCWVDRGRGTLG